MCNLPHPECRRDRQRFSIRPEKSMDAQTSSVEVSEQMEEGPGRPDLEVANDIFVEALPGHSLLAVLVPAHPPEPKNARIVRLFDIEAAEYDPKPGQAV